MTTTPTSPPGYRDGIEAAVEDIIDELTNRKGLRHAIDNIDDEMLAEIKAALAGIILKAIPTPDTLPTGWNSDMGAAPRDGTWVLVYASPREGLPGFVCPAAYHQDAGWCVDELRHATHWMPLPPPPPEE
jgi:hypothetical protein